MIVLPVDSDSFQVSENLSTPINLKPLKCLNLVHPNMKRTKQNENKTMCNEQKL